MNNVAICGDISMKQDTEMVKMPSGETIRREVHPNVSLAELGWLAGMITGEGCISAYFVNARRYDRGPEEAAGKPQLKVSIKIAGGMLEDMNKIKNIVEKLTASCHVTWWLRKDRKYYTGNAEINGQANVEKVLLATLPYLSSKCAQAGQLLQIITYRRSIIWAGVPGHDANTDSQLQEMINHLSELKNTGKISKDEPLNDCTPHSLIKRIVIKKLKTMPQEQVAQLLFQVGDTV